MHKLEYGLILTEDLGISLAEEMEEMVGMVVWAESEDLELTEVVNLVIL